MANDRINWIKKRLVPGESTQQAYYLYDEYVDQFGKIDMETFKRYIREAVREKQTTQSHQQKEEKHRDVKFEQDLANNSIFYEIKSEDVQTLEDLIQFANIDTTVWDCTKVVANKWGRDLTQIKGWFNKRTSADYSPEVYASRFEELVKMYKPTHVHALPQNLQLDEELLTEVALFDIHYGQLSWGEETTKGDYDIKIATKMVDDAVDHFVEKLGNRTTRWLFPIGNDWFNSDSSGTIPATYAGTPQAEDTRYQKTFTTAEELMIRSIDKLRAYAPVDVVIVPGNHDKSKVFYFGEFLRAWYRDDEYVDVDNSPTKHKYYTYGNLLLLLTHGDGLHKGALPLFVAQDVPELFGQAKYVEIHKGHFHSGEEKKYRLSKHTFGIREEVIPSLVPPDDWHRGKMYGSLRQCMSICFNLYKGRDSVHYWHPE